MVQVQVKELSVQELQAQHEALNNQAGVYRGKIHDLEGVLANPDVDPTTDFSIAVAAVANTDAELRTARAYLTATERQRDAVAKAVQEAREREKRARLEALKPREDAVKVRLAETFRAYVAALEEAKVVGREIQHVGGGSNLLEITRDDTRRGMRKHAALLRNFAGADVSENILG